MYIYECTIYHTTASVVSPPTGNDTSVADFETNHKASAVAVESIQIAETSFVIEKTYSEFETLIAGGLSWADVKYVEGSVSYHLFLVSEAEL
jgi:hypothetical protein